MKTSITSITTNVFLSFCFLFLAQILTAQACYIEQRQENAFAIVNDGVASGQNFIACETGMITEIGVRFATVGENTNKLQFVGWCYRSTWNCWLETTSIVYWKQEKFIRNGA